MATGTITNTVQRPDGTTPSHVHVKVTLMGADALPLTSPYVTATGTLIDGVSEFSTLNGQWTATLQRNSDITPSGTQYQVVQVIDSKTAYVDYITVTGSGTLTSMLTSGPPGALPPAAAQAYTDANAATALRYGFGVQATAEGFMPVGLNSATGRVYAVRDTAVATLFCTDDPSFRTWTCLHDFTGVVSIGNVWVTAGGTLLANGGPDLYRSTDGGITWASVLNDANMGATSRGLCQLADGTLLLGHYFAPQGATTYTCKLWRSTNDGATWTVAQSWANAGNGASSPIRHIHCVRADPNVTGRAWIAAGDGDWQVWVGYTDDKGDTITQIGSGNQTWRTVDILFNSTSLFFGCDGNSVPEYVIRWDRATGTRTNISKVANNSLYYGGMDSRGQIAWTQVWEPGTYIKAEAAIMCGPSDGSALIQNVLRIPSMPESTQVGPSLYGPDLNDCFIIGLSWVRPSRNAYRLIKGKIVLNDTADQIPILENRRPRSRGPSFIAVGPDSNVVGTGQNTVVANRLYLRKFRADVDLFLRNVIYGVGTASSGNVVVGIADCDDAGNARNIIGITGLTPVGPISTPQTLTLTRPASIVAGEEYWSFIGFDSAPNIRSIGSAPLTTGQLTRVLNVASLPPASPLAAQTTGTIEMPLVFLQ